MTEFRPSDPVIDALVEALRPLVVEVVREEFDRLVREQLRDRKTWLTLDEAAGRTGCSTDAVRMRANRGRYRTKHVGSRRYVLAEDVDRS